MSVSRALLEQNEKVAPGAGIKESRHSKRHVKGLAGHARKCESTGNSSLNPQFSKKVLAEEPTRLEAPVMSGMHVDWYRNRSCFA